MGGIHNEDPENMYSKVQLLSANNTLWEDEVPLPQINEDGATTLNTVKVNTMFCWKTSKLGRPNHPSKQFKRIKGKNSDAMPQLLKKQAALDLNTKVKPLSKKREPLQQKKENRQPEHNVKNYKGETITENQKVAVAYDSKFYIGQVQSIKEGNKVQINYFKRSREGFYTWPKRKDVDTVGVEFIFYTDIVLVGEGVQGGYIENEDEVNDAFEQFQHDYM